MHLSGDAVSLLAFLLSVYLSVCLSVCFAEDTVSCLSVCLISACLSGETVSCLSVILSICLSLWRICVLSVFLSACLPLGLMLCQESQSHKWWNTLQDVRMHKHGLCAGSQTQACTHTNTAMNRSAHTHTHTVVGPLDKATCLPCLISPL